MSPLLLNFCKWINSMVPPINENGSVRAGSHKHSLPKMCWDCDLNHLFECAYMWVEAADWLRCRVLPEDVEKGSGSCCAVHLAARGDHPC